MANNVGTATENPQHSVNATVVTGNQQSPQNLASTSSINTESSSSAVPLGSTTAVKTSPLDLSNNKSDLDHNLAAFIPIAVLIVVAIVMSVYIHLSSKKSSQNL